MTFQEANLDKQGTDDLAALERFVVENDDLLALETLISRFNAKGSCDEKLAPFVASIDAYRNDQERPTQGRA